MLFRGYLPIMSGAAMADFLQARGVDRWGLKAFLLTQGARLKKHAMEMAAAAGRPAPLAVATPGGRIDAVPAVADPDLPRAPARLRVAFAVGRIRAADVVDRDLVKDVMVGVQGRDATNRGRIQCGAQPLAHRAMRDRFFGCGARRGTGCHLTTPT